jgi:hypothetical protein
VSVTVVLADRPTVSPSRREAERVLCGTALPTVWSLRRVPGRSSRSSVRFVRVGTR